MLTLAIQAGLYFLALLYSWAVIYGKFRKEHAIQPRDYREDAFPKRIPLIALNASLVLTFAASSYYLLQDYFILDAFPPIGLLLVQYLIFFVIDDAWFYLMHRSMHAIPWLMNVVHKRHHTASKPFPLDYMYVHPLEWMIGMLGPALGALTVLLIWGEMYAWVMWIVIIIRNLHEMQAHSGLKSTWMKYSLFLGTSDHHDLHHAKLQGNYGSSTRIWDLIFRTEIKHKAKKPTPQPVREKETTPV